MKEMMSKKNGKKFAIQVDPWLNKYSNVVLCPDKVEKAKQSLEKFGLPDVEKIRK